MTKLSHYSEAFWDVDYCGTTGFETIVKRMREGRQMCKDLDEFLKTRARIEEDYSKQLQRLARNAGGTMEIGTLRSAWDKLKGETERIAAEHLEASIAMMDASNRLANFREAQKNAAKQEEDNARKYIRKKLENYQKTVRAKTSYDKLSKEQNLIDTQVTSAKNAGVASMAPKDLDKLYAKQSENKHKLEKADQTYKTCIDTLEQSRQQWEKEMVNACNLFQQLEEERIAFVRNEMWVHMNTVSQTCTDVDEHGEEVRKTLERCNVEEDIEKFINDRKTGMIRPTPIIYEPSSLQDPKKLTSQTLPEHNHGPQGGLRLPPPRRPPISDDDGLYADIGTDL